MQRATITTLTDDQIDDLLYFARTGQLDDFRDSIEAFARNSNISHYEVVCAAVEQQSSNSSFHMASANGHTNVLNYLLAVMHPAPQEVRTLTLNLQNASGNTSLHWASLNGHLDAVKLLMGAGADPTVMNKAGHDAVYEAEINFKDDVVEWLMTEGNRSEPGHAVDQDPGAEHDQGDEKEGDQEIDQGVGNLTIG
ncbi:hypothetical protein MMC07_002293 [Pseudocyphellaria aurata]|nr:hypothetical protein [Pseudocyphellaria aurata]